MAFHPVLVSGGAYKRQFTVVKQNKHESKTTPCDWLTKLAPLSQPMRSKTKTDHM